MNIIVVGSSGMLGHTVKKYLDRYYSVFKLDRSDLNLTNVDITTLENHIKYLSYSDEKTILVNCAGLIKQRNVSDHDMIDINATLPHKLAHVCEHLNIKMIHFSTDCVYSGTKGMYIETDKHDAVDIYGQSKSLGEPKCCSVIRTSIIGEEQRNKLSLVEWVKSNKNGSIKGFTNHLWNGITCLQAGKLIHEIVQKQLFWFGVRHIHSNTVNKHQLVSIINNIYNLNIDIVATEDLTPINRTLSSTHNMQNMNIPSLENQIQEMKEFYAS
jgi:dTDP-4-dehydrorhamnose reductase